MKEYFEISYTAKFRKWFDMTEEDILNSLKEMYGAKWKFKVKKILPLDTISPVITSTKMVIADGNKGMDRG